MAKKKPPDDKPQRRRPRSFRSKNDSPLPVPAPKPTPACYATVTRCTLHLEVFHNHDSGLGVARLSRPYIWPGVPQSGMGVQQSSTDCPIGPSRVADAYVDLDEPGLGMQVVLAPMDLAENAYMHNDMHDGPPLSHGSDLFRDSVRSLLSAGWKLRSAEWCRRKQGAPEEMSPEDFDGDDFGDSVED